MNGCSSRSARQRGRRGQTPKKLYPCLFSVFLGRLRLREFPESWYGTPRKLLSQNPGNHRVSASIEVAFHRIIPLLWIGYIPKIREDVDIHSAVVRDDGA